MRQWPSIITNRLCNTTLELGYFDGVLSYRLEEEENVSDRITNLNSMQIVIWHWQKFSRKRPWPTSSSLLSLQTRWHNTLRRILNFRPQISRQLASEVRATGSWHTYINIRKSNTLQARPVMWVKSVGWLRIQHYSTQHIICHAFQFLLHFTDLFPFDLWHDQGKWVTCQKMSIPSSFCQFPITSKCFILMQTPLKLDTWLQSYEEFVKAKNNIKQKNLKMFFANISETISPTSDSFPLIMCRIFVRNIYCFEIA